MAILSHYLHNKNLSYVKPYEKLGLKFMQETFNHSSLSVNSNFSSDDQVLKFWFSKFFAVPFLPSLNPKITFIDLFAGISVLDLLCKSLVVNVCFLKKLMYRRKRHIY